MAGIITHIAVADIISEKIGKGKIASLPYFFSGNIAPDAIHARENFVREMKKHTHFRDGIRDVNFLEAQNSEIFYKRIEKFIESYCNKASDDYDLYCGYLSHVITDEIFHRTIRQDFLEVMKNKGIAQSDKAFFTNISSDLNNIDYRLSQEYPFKHNPKDTLWSVQYYEVRDYLSSSELGSSKGWVTWNFFDNKREYEAPKYISYEKVLEFIDSSADEIIYRLKTYGLY